MSRVPIKAKLMSVLLIATAFLSPFVECEETNKINLSNYDYIHWSISMNKLTLSFMLRDIMNYVWQVHFIETLYSHLRWMAVGCSWVVYGVYVILQDFQNLCLRNYSYLPWEYSFGISIDIKFGKQIGLLKIQVKFEDGLCRCLL